MQFKENYVYKNLSNQSETYEESATMTGILVKTLIILGVALFSTICFLGLFDFTSSSMTIITVIASVVCFGLQFAIIFNPHAAKTLSIPYAIGQGFLIASFVGILYFLIGNTGLALAIVALVATIAIFATATVLYLNGKIAVSSTFRRIILTVSIGLIVANLLFLVVNLVFMLVKNINLYSLFIDSPIALIFGALMIFLASAYIVLSLDNARRITEQGFGKTYEWYAGFGIAINVIWLYIEILRYLIIIFARNRD